MIDKMKNRIINFSIFLIAFFVGTIFGYNKGVYNHIVFDAPNRVTIYDVGIESQVSKDIFFLNLIDQQGWATKDFENKTFKLLLNLPVHKHLSEKYEKNILLAEKYWDQTFKTLENE